MSNGYTFFDHQLKAISELRNGSLLNGGVGSGKSITAIAYFLTRCGVEFKSNDMGDQTPMTRPMDLYIISTAAKRNKGEWIQDYALVTQFKTLPINVTVDSWNNVQKYINVKNAFFIFDEQKVVGAGKWAKSFVSIAKGNEWILLSATPGDTWSDYIPLFLANGFYKNRSEFIERHVRYKPYCKFPVIDRYLECGRLLRLRDSITVSMEDQRTTKRQYYNRMVEVDYSLLECVEVQRWNPYTEEPITNATEYYYTMRRVVNETDHKLKVVRELLDDHDRLIIFYNFDYELDMLLSLTHHTTVAQYNGHKHDPIPMDDKWVYLVQYTAGAEGWNCISTDAMVFYSLNYSYKIMEQATGRIDRMNTPFKTLHYYHLVTNTKIDKLIDKCLKKKKKFNDTKW